MKAELVISCKTFSIDVSSTYTIYTRIMAGPQANNGIKTVLPSKVLSMIQQLFT